MGILNVTPDSFSDGGAYTNPVQAAAHAVKLWESGAAIIDIGAESTRPGAAPVSTKEELRRLLPIVEAVVAAVPLPISVDTRRATVMRAAWTLGAGFMNDVTALQGDPDALGTLAELDIPVCLMHMRGTPQTMQGDAHYDHVLQEVNNYLLQRVADCEAAGIRRERLLIDPGFGFAKNLQDNCRLLFALEEMQSLGLPIVVGVSRKRMIGELTGVADAVARTAGSVAAALWAVQHGAAMVRVHDVAETVQALRVWEGIQQFGGRSAPEGK